MLSSLSLFSSRSHDSGPLVLLISIFGQFSGNGLGYFNYVIYNNLGYTSPQTQLALTLGGSFLSAICGVTGAAFADKMVRFSYK